MEDQEFLALKHTYSIRLLKYVGVVTPLALPGISLALVARCSLLTFYMCMYSAYMYE